MKFAMYVARLWLIVMCVGLVLLLWFLMCHTKLDYKPKCCASHHSYADQPHCFYELCMFLSHTPSHPH
jgi:hypothetical protein